MKKYIIIGASSGIGKEIIKKLLARDYHVAGTYHNNPPDIEHPNLDLHHLDVLSNPVELPEIEGPVDGVAYLPGAINLKPFHRLSPESFMADYELQVLGAVKVIQKLLPALKSAEKASIVLFSTVAVQNGFNFHSQVSASKGAIEGLTRALAAELAPGIRVNAIAPSLTDTPLAGRLLENDAKKSANAERHPLKRIGNPEDIAAMAAFLLDEESSWISGQVISVDGGMSRLKL